MERKKLRPKVGMFIAVLFLLFVTLATLTPAQSILTLAKNYDLALRTFEQQRGALTLETVFKKGKVLSDKYEELAKLSEADYRRFEKHMRDLW